MASVDIIDITIKLKQWYYVGFIKNRFQIMYEYADIWFLYGFYNWMIHLFEYGYRGIF